jgi:PilZ domain
LERREQTRYGVRALVDFEWIDKGVPHHGRGHTRDISAKGMFIYSDSEPPAKADLQVEVSFRPPTEALRKLQLSARSLVLRVESAASRNEVRGFAILNRSYKLHNGSSAIEEGDWGIEIH